MKSEGKAWIRVHTFEEMKERKWKLFCVYFNKIIEHGKEERRPIGHTFTDKEGEFVFGPLCPGKEYALQIWVNDTKKIKICAKCHHEGKCLKGDKCDKCDCFIDDCDKCEKCEKEDCFEKPECK